MKLSFQNIAKAKDNPTKIVVSVPLRMPGNVIKHKEVVFKIFQSFDYIRAIPLCDEKTRDILNLPPELAFHIADGVAINVRPAWKDVARNIAEVLASRQPFSLS